MNDVFSAKSVCVYVPVLLTVRLFVCVLTNADSTN